jgi:hypothetical protein
MPITAALPALAGAGASIYGASKAAKASSKAANQALALQQQQYQQARTDMQPYMQAGQAGLNALQQRVLGAQGGGGPQAGAEPGAFGNTANPAYSQASYTAPTYQAPDAFHYNANDYTQSPGYQWQLQQGLGAINSGYANRGAMDSGAAMKSLASYAQGLATQDFNAQRQFASDQYSKDRDFSRGAYVSDRDFGRNVYDTDASRARSNYQDDRDYMTGRYDNQTGNLKGLAGMGYDAANGLVTAGTNYANGASGVLSDSGKTQSSVWNGAAGNTVNAAGNMNDLAATLWPSQFKARPTSK